MFGGKWFISYNIKIIRSSLPMKRTKTATQHLLIPVDIPTTRHSLGLGTVGLFEVTCYICKSLYFEQF